MLIISRTHHYFSYHLLSERLIPATLNITKQVLVQSLAYQQGFHLTHVYNYPTYRSISKGFCMFIVVVVVKENLIFLYSKTMKTQRG